MAMDGLCLYASVWELQALLGGKIDKITQPSKDEMIFTIRAGGKNHRLLISASAERCGMYLTELKRTNPMEAPMFCMLLRKKISGGRIERIEQPSMDRVVHIVIQGSNELGDSVCYTLVAEIMGKHSNIILCDENGLIIDAIRRIGPGVSTVRTVLPAQAYLAPPRQDKKDPREASKEDFRAVLALDGRADNLFSMRFFGLAPNVAAQMIEGVCERRETAEMCEEEKDALAHWFYRFYQDIAKGVFSPCLLCNAYGEPLGVYPFLLRTPHSKAAQSIGQAMDEYFSRHELYDFMRQKSASLRHVLQNNIERCEKKLSLYAQALGADEEMERNRLYGELLTANLHMLRKNASEAVVSNYYENPPQSIIIPMDRQHTPGENAQRYYKKYQKAKAAAQMALAQREQALSELAYLEGQLDNLDKCSAADELTEIADELRELGYIRQEKRPNKAQKTPASKPMHYISSDGADIFVGKNNRQNDMLTLHFAEGDDIWLHTKDIPGSHVILKCAAPSAAALKEAAILAAYYSKARGGENVAVDYTPRKYVKKPGGAKPGMVIYVKNKTAYVTPEEGVVKLLKQAGE